MLRKLIVICLTILLSSLGCTVVMPHAEAITPTIVYVDPHMIVNQALIPNTTFNISIKVDNIPADPGIVGVQFYLYWNSSVLNGVSMQEILFHSTMPDETEIADNLNRIKSRVFADHAEYAYTYLDTERAITGGYAPISGSHTIANITLKVVGFGKCAIHFDPPNTILGDPSARPLPRQLADGFFSNVPPPPPALIYVSPPTISNISLTPGLDFNVNVSIMNASGVYGLQFQVGFNASVVKASAVTPGSLIPMSATIVTQIDNTTGFVMFNASFSSSLDGEGPLAVVNFHVEGLGGTPLHIYGVQLVDSFGQPLSCTTSDGSFDNVLLAKLAVDPPEIINPALVPPATFSVNVTIEEVRDLYGYEFNLTFDPKILVCLQVQVNDVLGETNYTPNQNIDNTAGFIMIDVSYYPPAVSLDIDSPTPLVSIKFRVKAIGGTNLTLTETELVDSTGQPITHEIQNGYFQSLIVDIAVVDLYGSPTSIYKGGATNITIVVANIGNTTQSFTLNVYYNTTLLTSVNVPSLAADTNTTVMVTWNTASVQWGKYVMSAQVPPLLYETKTANNNLTDGIVKVRIPGDLNEDDVVNILDSIELSNAYGTSDPTADLNGDNIVNILDAIILANYFGQKI